MTDSPTTLQGVDISNLQGPPAVYRTLNWYTSAQFVIAQAINPPKPFRGWDSGGYTVEQLRAAKADGKKIGIYVFLWNTLSDVAADIRARLALIPDDLAAQLDFPVLVDVEDEAPCPVEQRLAAIDAARQVADEFGAAHGLGPSWGYSRDEYITDFLGGQWPADWKYWQCAPGADPSDLLDMRPMRQFAIDSIDHDSVRVQDLVDHTVPAQPQEPARETPEDWQWPTWRESAINLKSIADTLGQQLADATGTLQQSVQDATAPLQAKIAAAMAALQ